MAQQLFQILAATMVTVGLLVLAMAQLPIIGQATGIRGGRDGLRLLRPGTGKDPAPSLHAAHMDTMPRMKFYPSAHSHRPVAM